MTKMLLGFQCMKVCSSKVCGEASSLVVIKVESVIILLTLILLLDTGLALTWRFMCVFVSVCVWVCEQTLVSWPSVFAEIRCTE